MRESPLLAQGREITATLREMVGVQAKDARTMEVLKAATPSIEFLRWGGWNDEVAIYSLHLSVPAALFARLEADLERIETAIGFWLERMQLGDNDESLAVCSIRPQLLAIGDADRNNEPSHRETERIWESGQIRLFLSHVSSHKRVTAIVKENLAEMGISAFVAHDDIEPTLEWQKEIETALQSMDVMCALLTPDFRGSKWTDQEVGFALGRRVPVIPVRLGADPHGFIGKVQAVTAPIETPKAIASAIFECLTRLDDFRDRAIEGLVARVVEAPSYGDAIAAMKRVEAQKGFLSHSQIERLLRAAKDNSQVFGAFGVTKQIEQIAKAAKVSLPVEKLQNVADDEIPF
jgi:hypothetical protein